VIAGFECEKGELENVRQTVPTSWVYEPSSLNDRGLISVYSPRFDTLEEAEAWLKRWAERYCPLLRKKRPKP
jgi:hypothetical protein